MKTGAPLSLFDKIFEEDIMKNDIPFISHMYTVIEDFIEEYNRKSEKDKSYYNSKLDYDSEYCYNTTAWD